MSEFSPQPNPTPEEISENVRKVLEESAWIDEIDPTFSAGTISTEALARRLGIDLPEVKE